MNHKNKREVSIFVRAVDYGWVDSIIECLVQEVFSFPIPLAERTGRSLSRSISSSFPFSCEGRCRATRCLFEESLWNLLSTLFWPCRHGGGDESWICRCPLTAHSKTVYSAWCLSTGLGGKYSLNSWRQISLHPFTCFVFQVEYSWSYPRPFLHFFLGSLSLNLILERKSQWKQPNVFLLLARGR